MISRPERDANGATRVQTVEQVFRLEAPVLQMTVGGQEIETTLEHPFYVDGLGWTEAQYLEVGDPAKNFEDGDHLIGSDGKLTPIEAITFAGRTKPVYNMSITNDHTYFVGDVGWGFSVWVHNSCNVYRSGSGPDTSYVGITNNVRRRDYEHLRKFGRRIRAIEGLTEITRRQARAVEHILIEKLGRKFNRAGQSLGGQLDNINRGIDPKKLSQFEEELQWAKQILSQLDNL